ncbi:MAG: IS21 family transposase [Chloroflexi bacterium]|nr:IS21 family transposase [Chloroflexota bacterium]
MERLHVNHVRDIVYRLRRGQSERQIAADLRASRVTVHKYHEVAGQSGLLDCRVGLASDRELAAKLGPMTLPPRVVSTVEPYREVVEKLLLDGVEMVAMLSRLKEHGYGGSYSSVRRFVAHLRPAAVEPCIRIHTRPGEEAQVDFGSVGRLVDPRDGLARVAYAFVMTLSFSRHQYAELVFDQKVATWIGCHRHAFESFGGVPGRVVLDNLKAAVIEASLHDPVLGEAYRRMAQYYRFVVSPNRPRTPEHKGKVESGVHYLQRNFMAGQQFTDMVSANERLREWVKEVAGVRRHGTTGKAPLAEFREAERAALLPLPEVPFSLCEVRRVKVHPDCHVVIEGSFYSVPYQHVGKELDAYVGERVVEIFQGVDLLTTHPKARRRGEWQTRVEHYPPEKAAYLERTPARCLEIAKGIGPKTREVVETLLSEHPLDRLRSVQSILRLAESVGRERLEAACARALYYGDPRYRRIKDILNAALDREALPAEPIAFLSAQQQRAQGRQYAFARAASEFFETEEAAR